MNSLAGLFYRYGNRKEFRTTCPFCSERRKNRKDPCLSVKQDDDCWVYNCWHCQAKGKEDKEMEAAVVTAPVKTSSLDKSHYDFFNSRGLTRETVDNYSVSASTQFIRSIGKNVSCVGFAYRNNGVPYSYKWRSIESKGFCCTAAPQHFFLHDRVTTGENIVICEGEIDALSLRQAGVLTLCLFPMAHP